MSSPPDLYKKNYIEKGDERKEMFVALKNDFQIKRVLYPGCFVHITPSFYYEEVVYVDSDKRFDRFFKNAQTYEYIQNNKVYKETPVIRFYETSFENRIKEGTEYFDLLISQFSGFVSKHCGQYLKPGGILLVNDSHGDATYAYNSGQYDLIAIVNEELRIDYDEKEKYFMLPKNKKIEIDLLFKTMKGPKYKEMAFSYIFKKK